MLYANVMVPRQLAAYVATYGTTVPRQLVAYMAIYGTRFLSYLLFLSLICM